MSKDEAIDVMARRLMALHMESLDGEDWWESFPEIGEFDWESILLRARAYALDEPDEVEWKEALALLTVRAER